MRLTGSPSRLVRRPLPTDDPKRRCPDIGRATARLGWRPRIGLDDGLARTIRYFRDEMASAGASTRDAVKHGFPVADETFDAEALQGVPPRRAAKLGREPRLREQ